MKRTVGSILLSVIAMCMLMCVHVSVFAAGSWGTAEVRKSVLDGRNLSPMAVAYEFTGDAANGSVPVLTDTTIGGKIVAIDYEFGSPVPNSVLLVIKSIAGLTLYTGTAVTASGRVVPAAPIFINAGMTYTVTTNTTNSAKCKIVALIEYY